MKKFTTLVFAVITPLALLAQKTEPGKNVFRFGFNVSTYGQRQVHTYTTHTSDSLTGSTVYLEYSHYFNPYIAVVPRIFSGLAHKTEKHYNTEFIDYNSTIGLSLSARITPFPHSFNKLSIDAGILAHNIATTFSTIGNWGVYETYSNVNTFGLSNSVILDIITTNKFIMGVRIDLLTGFYEGKLKLDSKQAGVYLGARF